MQTPIAAERIEQATLAHGIMGGLDISGFTEVDGASNAWLLCCTEMNTKEQMTKLVGLLAEMGS